MERMRPPLGGDQAFWKAAASSNRYSTAKRSLQRSWS